MNKPSLHDQCCPICGNKKISYWGSASDIGRTDIKHDLSKCKSCTHIFINPLPSADFLREAYKICNPSVFSSNGFVEARSVGPFTVADELVWSHVSEATFKGNFLDIGSANLGLLKAIRDIGWELTLIEPSQHAGQFEEKLGCAVYNCPFEDCTFEKKYEIIAVIDVLEHVHSPVEVLKGIAGILSKGGVALFRFPNSYSIRAKLKHDKWEMLRPLGHLHYFSPRSFKVACEMSKLKVEEIRSHDLYNYYGLHKYIDKILKTRSCGRFIRNRLDKALLGDQLFVTVNI